MCVHNPMLVRGAIFKKKEKERKADMFCKALCISVALNTFIFVYQKDVVRSNVSGGGDNDLIFVVLP